MKTAPSCKIKSFAMAVVAAALLSGCATSGNPADPIEGLNRVVYAFNDGLDSVIIKPVAKGYDAVLPSPVRTGVSNFFGNIEDVLIGFNNILQGKVTDGFRDFSRVLINSTFGVLGLIDWASDAGIEKHDEDFGQTFGRWGVGNGPYLMVPVFGPRTTRDTVGLILDSKADPIGRISKVPTRNTLIALRIINSRANWLSADRVIDEASLDRYSYLRDAYLQRRRSLIYDGDAPREKGADAEQLDHPAVSDATAHEPRADAMKPDDASGALHPLASMSTESLAVR